jgi:hypothetical protein
MSLTYQRYRFQILSIVSFLILSVVGLFAGKTCYADAMIRTQAMQATSIVEDYVEDKAIIAMELESQLQSLGNDVSSIVDTAEKAIEKAEINKLEGYNG